MIPQPFRHPSVLFCSLLLPTLHCWALDPSLQVLTLFLCAQRIVADSGRGLSWPGLPQGEGSWRVGTMAPQGQANWPPRTPISCHCLLSGHLLQPEMCPRPLRAQSKISEALCPPNSRPKAPSASPPGRSWGWGPWLFTTYPWKTGGWHIRALGPGLPLSAPVAF